MNTEEKHPFETQSYPTKEEYDARPDRSAGVNYTSDPFDCRDTRQLLDELTRATGQLANTLAGSVGVVRSGSTDHKLRDALHLVGKLESVVEGLALVAGRR